VLVDRDGGFDFLHSVAAMSVLGSYVTAYAIRISKEHKQDNRAFFGVEQISATATLLYACPLIFHSPGILGWLGEVLDHYRGAFKGPHALWPWPILSGTAFGAVGIFSVFLFMFKGRTATFAGLVNRLTLLIAGTTATLVFYFAFGGRSPLVRDWISLGLILVAIALSRAGRKRVVELAGAGEIEGRRPGGR
jgi:drug/metabolite transporter (DMT)-like permease